MILDRILALAALMAFAASVGVIIYFVPELDLGTVIVIAVAAAAFDFWRSLWLQRNRER